MCTRYRTTPFSPPRRCCEASASLFKFQKRCRKEFSPLWNSCETGASLFYVWEAPYNAVLTSEEGLWSTCRPVEVPIRMERVFTIEEVLCSWCRTCLYAKNTLQRRFNRRGGAVKHVQSLFMWQKRWRTHYCGGLEKLVQGCLSVGNTIQLRFHRRK